MKTPPAIASSHDLLHASPRLVRKDGKNQADQIHDAPSLRSPFGASRPRLTAWADRPLTTRHPPREGRPLKGADRRRRGSVMSLLLLGGRGGGRRLVQLSAFRIETPARRVAEGAVATLRTRAAPVPPAQRDQRSVGSLGSRHGCARLGSLFMDRMPRCAVALTAH